MDGHLLRPCAADGNRYRPLGGCQGLRRDRRRANAGLGRLRLRSPHRGIELLRTVRYWQQHRDYSLSLAGTPVVTTSFARGPWEKHRVWYELLHGNRGLIIWDDKSAFVGHDNIVGERGREVAPYYKEL